MDKIICLVGESGSGKTAIAKALEQSGYNVILSYTSDEAFINIQESTQGDPL